MLRTTLIALAGALNATSASAEEIWVTMDQVRVHSLEQEAAQIVVGNPGIADVTVQDSSKILIFGKAPGLTNFYIMDADGNTVGDLAVRVRAYGGGMLTLQRGQLRTTMNCMTVCEPTATVGDDQNTFQILTQQSQLKLQQGQQAPGAN